MIHEIENNKMNLSGRILTPFEFHHESLGESFYRTFVGACRLSDTVDVLPVYVSERLLDVTQDYTGQSVIIKGRYQSYNEQRGDGQRSKLELYVFALDITVGPDSYVEGSDVNIVNLNGFLCRKPAYRKTSRGRDVVDIMLAVNRKYGRSDYIPCIVWGRTAQIVRDLPIGTRLEVFGRVQSREYTKKLGDGGTAKHTAYEVSVQDLNIVDE